MLNFFIKKNSQNKAALIILKKKQSKQGCFDYFKKKTGQPS